MITAEPWPERRRGASLADSLACCTGLRSTLCGVASAEKCASSAPSPG